MKTHWSLEKLVGKEWFVLTTIHKGEKKAREYIEKQRMRWETNFYNQRGESPILRIVEA